jgi:hypothetical protein
MELTAARLCLVVGLASSPGHASGFVLFCVLDPRSEQRGRSNLAK